MLRIVCPKGELENHQVGCDGLLPFNHSLFPNPDSRFPTTNPPSPLRRPGRQQKKPESRLSAAERLVISNFFYRDSEFPLSRWRT